MLRLSLILIFLIIDLKGQTNFDDFKKQHQQDIAKFKDNLDQDIENYKKQLAKDLANLKRTERTWNKITVGKDIVEADSNIKEPTIEKILEEKKQNPNARKQKPSEKPSQPKEEPTVEKIPEEKKPSEKPSQLKEEPSNIVDESEEDDTPQSDSDDSRPVPTISAQNIPTMFPLGKAKGRISSEFGYRNHPTYKFRKFHYGIDIAAPAGTSIYATAGGKVIQAGWTNGYGNYIVIEHAKGYKTAYAHLSRIGVKKGQQLKKGALIGKVGKTGVATGNHLHYEVIKNGKKVNPRPYFN